MKQKVEAYLNFDGDAKEALEYYKEIFEVTESQTMKWGDMPADEANEVSDSMDPDALLYGDLTIGSSNLMINDQPGTVEKKNDRIYLNWSCDDGGHVKKVWQKFVDTGAEVIMDLEEAFFANQFGIVKDKFEIIWFIMEYKTYDK